jgi:hypothetical protein
MRPVREHEVQLSRPLPFSVYDVEGTLLLEAGYIVNSNTLRNSLLERGFAQDGSAPVARRPPQQQEDGAGEEVAAPEPAGPEALSVAVPRLLASFEDTLSRLVQSSDWECGKRLDAARDALIELAERDHEAVLAILQVRARAESPAARALQAGSRIFRMCQELGLDTEITRDLVGAALSYDCTLAPLSLVLNQQASPLDARQQQAIRRHPETAAAALRDAGIESKTWLDAVLQHHERIDGSGYPRGLIGRTVGQGARLVAMVDVHAALLRPRAYRGAVDPSEALQILFKQRCENIDPALAERFLRCIGVYAPGAIVRLETREIAVVFRRGSTLSTPRVRVLLDSLGGLDSENIERNTARPGQRIVESLGPGPYAGLLRGLERLWD